MTWLRVMSIDRSHILSRYASYRNDCLLVFSGFRLKKNCCMSIYIINRNHGIRCYGLLHEIEFRKDFFPRLRSSESLNSG